MEEGAGGVCRLGAWGTGGGGSEEDSAGDTGCFSEETALFFFFFVLFFLHFFAPMLFHELGLWSTLAAS